VEVPIKGSHLEGDFTNLRKKVRNKIKARKADGAKLKVWLIRSSMESPYKLRSKTRKKTKFSETIIKMAKAISAIELEMEEGEPQFQLS
jgi:hypothetical protein